MPGDASSHCIPFTTHIRSVLDYGRRFPAGLLMVSTELAAANQHRALLQHGTGSRSRAPVRSRMAAW